MRLSELITIFPDQNLQEFFFNVTRQRKEISTRDMTNMLLADKAYETLLPTYTQSLVKIKDHPSYKTHCLVLIRRLHDAHAECTSIQQREFIGKVIQQQGIALKQIDIAIKFQYDTVTLDQLPRYVEVLRKPNNELAQLITTEMDEAATFGLQFAQAAHRKTLLAPGVNANLFNSDTQSFILAALPTTMHEAKEFFQAAIDKGTTLFISAHSLFDGAEKKRVGDFWMQHKVSEITLDNNITIKNYAPKILAFGKQTFPLEAWPCLIESTLELSNGRKLTHIHYKAWPDCRACPDEELLETLFQRMEELSPNPKIPIAINCYGGVGRTGAIAVSYYLRQRLTKVAEIQPLDLDTMRINVPCTILQFRECRAQMVEDIPHYITIHSMVLRHYTALKQHQSIKTATGLLDSIVKKIASFNIS